MQLRELMGAGREAGDLQKGFLEEAEFSHKALKDVTI